MFENLNSFNETALSMFKPAETTRTDPKSLYDGKEKCTGSVLREFLLAMYKIFHDYETSKSYDTNYAEARSDFKNWLICNDTIHNCMVLIQLIQILLAVSS